MIDRFVFLLAIPLITYVFFQVVTLFFEGELDLALSGGFGMALFVYMVFTVLAIFVYIFSLVGNWLLSKFFVSRGIISETSVWFSIVSFGPICLLVLGFLTLVLVN